MTDTPLTPAEALVKETTRSIRRSIYQRFMWAGLSPMQLTLTVSQATRAAVARSNIADLATMVAASAPVIAALEAAAPNDPALATFKTVKDRVGIPIQDLLQL